MVSSSSPMGTMTITGTKRNMASPSICPSSMSTENSISSSRRSSEPAKHAGSRRNMQGKGDNLSENIHGRGPDRIPLPLAICHISIHSTHSRRSSYGSLSDDSWDIRFPLYKNDHPKFQRAYIKRVDIHLSVPFSNARRKPSEIIRNIYHSRKISSGK